MLQSQGICERSRVWSICLLYCKRLFYFEVRLRRSSPVTTSPTSASKPASHVLNRAVAHTHTVCNRSQEDSREATNAEDISSSQDSDAESPESLATTRHLEVGEARIPPLCFATGDRPFDSKRRKQFWPRANAARFFWQAVPVLLSKVQGHRTKHIRFRRPRAISMLRCVGHVLGCSSCKSYRRKCNRQGQRFRFQTSNPRHDTCPTWIGAPPKRSTPPQVCRTVQAVESVVPSPYLVG